MRRGRRHRVVYATGHTYFNYTVVVSKPAWLKRWKDMRDEGLPGYRVC